MLASLRTPARLLATTLVAAAMLVPAAAGTADAARAKPGSTGDACGATLAKPSGGTWSCSFVDNFDGSSLDSTKWVPADSAVSGYTLGSTCFVRGQGYAVSGGTLRLTVARKQPFTCSTPYGATTATYTGGAVSTYGKFSQAYGRFEARMAFPSRADGGLHGGFWMNPQTLSYGAWPASGEIDVAEWFSGVADHIYPTLHYSGSTSADTGWNCVIGDASTFHTYAVEWGSSKMDFIYDGQLCFSRSWTPTGMSAPAPFDKPFTASLLAAAGDKVDGTSTVPNATTTVDYVKIWH